jgi:hypothetical protein
LVPDFDIGEDISTQPLPAGYEEIGGDDAESATFSPEEFDRLHSLRAANRLFLADTKPYEFSDPGTAVERYRKALVNLREYAGHTRLGEPVILDRLTLCLMALGRLDDARTEADRYFAEYPFDRDGTIGERILKRLEGRLVTVRRPRVPPNRSEHGPAKLQQTTTRIADGESEKPYRPDLAVPKDQVERNLQGQELERQGFIDNAIEFYRANVRDGFEGNWPYDRLAIIYRRRKDRTSEVAILERAVEVFEALMGSSPRADVPFKLAKFRERLHTARRLGEKGA